MVATFLEEVGLIGIWAQRSPSIRIFNAFVRLVQHAKQTQLPMSDWSTIFFFTTYIEVDQLQSVM